MEQHSVPQHIASFEFKLFGNLTVRQFITLAIPMAFAAVIFFSPLPTFVRMPLAGLFGLFGLFAALVPIGGRSFDKWIVAFIKAIISPTQRVWIKERKLPEFLTIIVSSPVSEKEVPEAVTTQGRERLLAYLRSLPKGEFSPMDVKEQVSLQRLNLETYQGPTPEGKLPTPIIWPTAPYKSLQPVETATREPLYAQTSLPQVSAITPLSMAQTAPEKEYIEALQASLPSIEAIPKTASVQIATYAKPFILPNLEKKLKEASIEKPVELIKIPIAHLASEMNFSIENVISIQTPDRGLKFFHPVGKTKVRKLHFAPPENFDLANLPIRGEARFEVSEALKKHFEFTESERLEIPPIQQKVTDTKITKPKTSLKRVHFVPKATPKLGVSSDVSLKPEAKEATDSQVSIKGQKSDQAKEGILTRAQIIPLTNRPNVISGLISDAAGVPLEGAILIVRDLNGIPQRALKTNKLGQFLSATSLTNGKHTIEVDSQLTNFAPITINLTGEVLAPLEIKAK